MRRFYVHRLVVCLLPVVAAEWGLIALALGRSDLAGRRLADAIHRGIPHFAGFGLCHVPGALRQIRRGACRDLADLGHYRSSAA
jgi:hypothetical protein